jgi:hypothetical protein
MNDTPVEKCCEKCFNKDAPECMQGKENSHLHFCPCHTEPPKGDVNIGWEEELEHISKELRNVGIPATNDFYRTLKVYIPAWLLSARAEERALKANYKGSFTDGYNERSKELLARTNNQLMELKREWKHGAEQERERIVALTEEWIEKKESFFKQAINGTTDSSHYAKGVVAILNDIRTDLLTRMRGGE